MENILRIDRICSALVGLGWIIPSLPVAADEWRLIKPTNSGVPGESVMSARFAPDGKLWVSARWPFFREGGIGIYDFDTETWETHANWDSPIPSEYVNDVEFAADGSVWMASGAITGPGGLVHKAGDEWTIYDRTNSPLLHNIVAAIDLDADGHVWVLNHGTQEVRSAVFEFDGESWRKFEAPTEIPFEAPWDGLAGMLVASDGHVFVTNTVLPGMAEFDGERWTLHGSDVTRFSGMMEDAEGNLWTAGGVGGGNLFYKFDRTTGEFTSYGSHNTPLANTTPTTLSRDRDGRVYLGNWFGQVVRSPDFGESWSLFTNQGIRITSIAQQGDGDFWVVTPGAVRHLDSNGTWLEAFNTYNTGIPDNFVDRLHRAPNGNMMVGSLGAGFSEYDGARWSNLGSHNPNDPWPVLADGVDTVFVDDTNSVWLGTNGVARYADGFLELWDWRNTPAFGVMGVKSLGQDGNGEIWGGTEYSGLYHFDGFEWEFVDLGATSGADRNIQKILRDSAGNMWVAAESALHRYDGARWQTWDWVSHPMLFDQRGIQSMAIGPDDIIWLGMGDGLIRFDGTTFSLFTQANSPLPAKNVRSIAFRESDGRMALSVHTFQAVTPFPHGLVLIDGPIEDSKNWTIHTFQDSPMRHYQLGDVAFDGDGNLWLVTVSEGVAILLNDVLPGDLNCDGSVSVGDINPFVLALTDPVGYADAFPDCDPLGGDCTGDGQLTVGDINCFVALVAGD